jgi:hypothetical protein
MQFHNGVISVPTDMCLRSGDKIEVVALIDIRCARRARLRQQKASIRIDSRCSFGNRRAEIAIDCGL